MDVITQEILDNMYLVFQPIVSIDDLETIVKYEVLVRSELKLKEGDKITLSPFDIFRCVDNSQVTSKVLDLTKKTLDELPDIVLSININIDDLLIKKTKKKIVKLSENYGNRLIFELIEKNELTQYKKVVREFIESVKYNNSKVALDDFGKSYSTFDPLLSFNFDILKIDEVISKNFEENLKKYYILDSLITLSKRLGYEVVIEYINNIEKIKLLEMNECPMYLQGFEIGKPITKKALYEKAYK